MASKNPIGYNKSRRCLFSNNPRNRWFLKVGIFSILDVYSFWTCQETLHCHCISRWLQGEGGWAMFNQMVGFSRGTGRIWFIHQFPKSQTFHDEVGVHLLLSVWLPNDLLAGAIDITQRLSLWYSDLSNFLSHTKPFQIDPKDRGIKLFSFFIF